MAAGGPVDGRREEAQEGCGEGEEVVWGVVGELEVGEGWGGSGGEGGGVVEGGEEAPGGGRGGMRGSGGWCGWKGSGIRKSFVVFAWCWVAGREVGGIKVLSFSVV